MIESKISIAIPTYKRPIILSENLLKMLPYIKKYHIPVYISDDSPDSETEKIVSCIKKYYANIYYRKNYPSLGHDLNCLSTLKWPDTRYVWYLGDSMLINEFGIEKVLEAIDQNPAFIFVNFNYGKSAPSTGYIPDLRLFLSESVWYLTLTGATVYSRRVLNWYYSVPERKIFKNFMQLGMILEYTDYFGKDGFWIKEQCLTANTKKKSYWRKDVISVFANDWAGTIQSFPGVFQQHMPSVLKSHSKNSGLYRLSNMLNFRSEGGITASILKKNKTALRETSYRSLIVFYILLLIPPGTLKTFKKLLKTNKIK